MNKKRLKQFFIILVGIISLLIIQISRKSFLNYEKIIVSQQQEQLLTISRLVGRSILNFVEDKVKMVDYLAENIKPDLLKEDRNDLLLKKLKAFSQSNGEQISSLHYLDFINNSNLTYPDNIVNDISFKNKYEFIEIMKTHKIMKGVYIGEVYKIAKKAYAFNIFKPIYRNKVLIGVIVVKIDVNDMYNLIVKPVRAGKFGYAMVKNSDGIIIMHPVKEQIGYDILVDRRKKYPDLDYSELEKLVKRQLSGTEGTYIYHSYWWPQEKLVKVKKFQAFTPIDITRKFWVVAVTMSYDEIHGAIKKYSYNITSIALTLISVISLALFIFMRMISNKEAHIIEMNYLKQINESSEGLRQKDTELHQRKRLETVGTLTGGIAHEFNNILTPIMGYSEMILMGLKPGDGIYDDMMVINDSSKKARDVIDQILLFSGDKNIAIQYKVLEINKVVKEALNFFESASHSNIKMNKKISENSGNVFANETQIHQVLLNLCINAYNSMKEREGELEVDLSVIKYNEDKTLRESGLDNKKYIKLSVKDNGCGMNEEILKQISDPFFYESQYENNTGFGLAVVMGIITKHGGKVFIESKVGEGTRVDVYLPQSDRKIKIDKLNVEVFQHGNERILIIDKQENIIEPLKKQLEELGYKVTTYTDTSEVIRDFNVLKDKLDIVISEIRMPEISGIQLAKKFKRNNIEIKILLMTGNTEEPLEEYIQNKIIDDYILKPVSAEKINKRIRKIMDKII
jgi:two-component system cell cycle sensor histidine kinase/response regulator CckA